MGGGFAGWSRDSSVTLGRCAETPPKARASARARARAGAVALTKVMVIVCTGAGAISWPCAPGVDIIVTILPRWVWGGGGGGLLSQEAVMTE